MIRRHLFILVPSPHPTGPIKGAYALANALAGEREVTVVSLKPGPGVDAPLNPQIRVISLVNAGKGWRERIYAYRNLLKDAGGRAHVASISLCLSADMVNRFCCGQAVICASVRGNLIQNYRLDYGPLGVPLALGHLATLRGFDHVVAMTTSMAQQVGFYARQTPTVIGNFVDEDSIEPYRVNVSTPGPIHLVFLGSLSVRKQPLLLLHAMHELRRRGLDVVMDVVGSGPLQAKMVEEMRRLELDRAITLHGHLAHPHQLVAKADAMVLPSLSEGLSRGALEALHLGVPCVLRETDGNAELIRFGVNGALFHHDEGLPDALLAAVKISKRLGTRRHSLLPPEYRQKTAARRYLALVEQKS